MVFDEDTIKRFWSKVDIKGDDECWLWKSRLDRWGYGKFSYKSRRITASRVAWKIINNSIIPSGIFICHSCDNPPCCNPEHLWAGTPKDNSLDRSKKNRAPKGCTHGRAKLSEKDVYDIRFWSSKGLTNSQLARDYSVVHTTVRDIVSRKTWSHLSEIDVSQVKDG